MFHFRSIFVCSRFIGSCALFHTLHNAGDESQTINRITLIFSLYTIYSNWHQKITLQTARKEGNRDRDVREWETEEI